ncbi:FAD binding domain-containing protein (plasmid) [Skermanella sp. TT6]|uniref:FAD binding domain-containing protein n=1 Tax=Skermanella cutis TaxID=2775420 RepID=A0ABX7BGA9_9PROT|nr:FAD binding domain-containing protein [Skermanella sp. TT6]QQP92810.1 FAD binding domain-containing protein [Skermanella sp. TT6]
MTTPSNLPAPLVGLRGRRRIAPFVLARPGGVAEAIALGQAPGSAWMGGGVDLMDGLKRGMPLDRLVPLGALAELGTISRCEDGVLRVGALATYQDLADSAVVREAAPDLAALIGTVANFRIRSKATVGGSVMSGNGQYDLMPALLALDAVLVLAGPDGDARIPAAALVPDEPRLLRAVEIPAGEVTRLRVDRTLRPAVCVFLGLAFHGGAVVRLRAAVSCAHPRPVLAELGPDRVAAADPARDAAALAAELAAGLPSPVDDGTASASYRRRVIPILIRRLLEASSTEPQA